MFKLKQKHIFITIGIMLFSWMIYTQFFASNEALKLSDYYHIDKLMHFLGGLLIAGVAIRYFRVSKVSALILLILLGVGWEIFEVFFLPNVRDFYEKFYAYWWSDTRGDIVVGIAGGLCYAIFYKRARGSLFLLGSSNSSKHIKA